MLESINRFFSVKTETKTANINDGLKVCKEVNSVSFKGDLVTLDKTNLPGKVPVINFFGDFSPTPEVSSEVPKVLSPALMKLIETGEKYGIKYSYGDDLEKYQNKVIKTVIKAKAKELGIPENVALGIAGHESGWKMWNKIDEANPTMVAGKNVVTKDKKKVLLSTDWGVMQVNDKAHPKVFPKVKNDLEYNIEFGLRFLKDVRREYKGSLGLGLGSWDKTIAAYNLGHAPGNNAEHIIARRYVGAVKKMAGKA